ncbi:MAG TPA: hypothetical protein VFR23_07735 [Jiangellaceae bacterium]|nr:hypothetical protein [Jiangellaceae bacterium]
MSSGDQQLLVGSSVQNFNGARAMTEAEQNAQHALQEAMDRRDNGGETGH